jgi:hypothetical protein
MAAYENIYNPENQREVEYFILLLLGTSSKGKLSVLHLEKEFFFLWNASDYIRPLMEFIAHYKGPYSQALVETIRSPMHLEGLWEYEGPKKQDDLSGGFVKLNEKGIQKYNEISSKIHSMDNKRLLNIIAVMNLLHDLYDNLDSKELLYFVYTNPNYKSYIRKSEVYNRIVTDEIKSNIVKKVRNIIED